MSAEEEAMQTETNKGDDVEQFLTGDDEKQSPIKEKVGEENESTEQKVEDIVVRHEEKTPLNCKCIFPHRLQSFLPVLYIVLS